ncbi:MAG: glycogen-binding domain-containing protein [Bryobacteraceae bacterium]
MPKPKEAAASAPNATVISCRAQDASTVFLAGTFNDWNPEATPMSRNDSGEWTVTLELVPGRYEYKFVVDGQWCCEPGCDDASFSSADTVMNALGTRNRSIEVS